MEENIKKTALSNTIWKFLERIIAQGISLIVSIVIARILSPDDYSVVALVTIFFTFANVIISGGLNTSLIQKKDSDRLDYSSVLFVSLIISIVLYFLLFFLAPAISSLYNNPLITPVLRIMGLSLPISAIKSIWCAYISTKLQFKKFFFATLGGTIISGIVGIVMALKGFGPWALVAQQMINLLVDTIVLVCCTRIRIVFKISFKRLKQLFSYGWKILAANLIGTLYSEISPLIVGLKFTQQDLSFFTKGRSFPNMLSTAFTSTLSAVLFPILAKKQESKDIILKYTRLFIRISSFVVFPLMLGFFAVAEDFVLIFLTEKWIQSVFYIRIFCLCSMFDIIAIGNCETIKAIGKSGVYLLIEIIKKSLYFLTIFLFVLFAQSPEVIACASLTCVIIQICINSIPNIKLIGYNIRSQLKDILPSLLISAAMCLLVLSIGFVIPAGSIRGFAIKIILGATFYFVFSSMLNNKTFKYVKETIMSLKKRRTN